MNTTPSDRARSPGQATLLVAAGALALFAPTVVQFNVQTTDLSAMRVLGGEVLYRDLWTMYAPGSIYVMALAYGIFGTQMLVGNALGILVSVASVAALHRLAARVLGPVPAIVVAAAFAFAFLAAGYQNSLAGYPPAILLIFLAFDRLAVHAETLRRRHLLAAGVLLGLTGLFKHDIAAYACIASAIGIAATPSSGWSGSARAISTLALPVVAIMALPIGLFVWAGAGPAMVHDFLVFPRTYFPHVRPEGFRVLPPLGADLQALWWWFDLNAPSWALLVGVPGVFRGWRTASGPSRRVLAMSMSVFVAFWLAAHVQANTHRISMAAFGALVCAVGMLDYGRVPRPSTAVTRGAMLAVVIWCLAMLVPWGARFYRAELGGQLIGLPRLTGIVAPRWQAEQFRELAEALDEAGPPEAPVLQVGWRNDVLIYAGATPYWLTDRRMVTPFHELHPGITDVEPGQRRMLEDLAGGPLPVVVREHRFQGDVLDLWGDRYRAGGVPVGATLLDEWVEANYVPWRRIGPYEVMRSRR
ncbi:MAG: hypothetical protein WEB90_04560 [Gemmatimonadota bacterium]